MMVKTESEPLDCFFVTPFGDKEHQMGGGTIPHFNLIHTAIKDIIESFPDKKIRFRRADEIADVGSVEETFIIALHKADVVVAELSATENANVFYELGIRFALRKGITIPIWQKGTVVPADLKGVLGIEYEGSNPRMQMEKFYQFLRSRLGGKIDSPVYKVLPDLHIYDAKEIQNLYHRIEELEKEIAETRLDISVQQTLDEAELHLDKNEIEAALETLKIAYKFAPKNLQLAVRYGQLLSRTGKHDEAISVLHTAVTLAAVAKGPTFIPFRELGMAYKRAGKPQLAVDCLMKAAAENPRDSDTHGIIGGVHKDAYEIDKAIEAYQRGFDADPKSTYCLLNIICLLIVRNNNGDKLRIKRLLSAANNLMAEAMGRKAVDLWADYDRAHYLIYTGKPSEAKTLFGTAIENTKSAGELRSARKNLDLLKDSETPIAEIQDILSMFDAAEARFAN
jgi:tetratricopeptide (TPR) repeat protein